MRARPLRLQSAVDIRSRPFLVAHRAGNRLELLRGAERLGVALVEADVRLFRGRPEVRHLKTLGPLPILWDRWEVRAPWHPRLRLSELLAASAPSTELMLDLKGRRRRLAEHVVEELEPYLGRRRFAVCARSWRLLEPFEALPVRRIHSVGSSRELRRLLRLSGRRVDGISIHERLLNTRVAEELRRLAPVVLTWPVNDPHRAVELVRLGVDGLITDRTDPVSISSLFASRTA